MTPARERGRTVKPLAGCGVRAYDLGLSESVSVSGVPRLEPLFVMARLAEFWFLLKARLSFLTGRRERARAALKSAIRRNPGSFFAHFMLGRLYWRDHVSVKAKREFDLAWQIDPERFERAYARLRETPDGAPELFTYTMDAQPSPVPLAIREEPRGDDFVDDEERARFDEMPPITSEEIRSIDWDRLEAEISDDSST